MYRKLVDVFGDRLEIQWTGSVWVSPCNGQQHARAEHAMRAELEAYFRSCGEDVSAEDTVEQIDGHIAQMVDEA